MPELRRKNGAGMSDNEARYYDALKRITLYDTPSRLGKHADREWGLTFNEALEMAYENIQNEARLAIKGRRRPESLASSERLRAPKGKRK